MSSQLVSHSAIAPGDAIKPPPATSEGPRSPKKTKAQKAPVSKLKQPVSPWPVNGKIAFVTGGASGIGLALVRRLLEEEANVISVDIASEDVLNKQREEFKSMFGDSRFMAIRCDVGNRLELNNAFGAALGTFGHIDILINNAALSDLAADLSGSATGEAVQAVLGVDLLAVAEGTRLALQHMRARGNGGAIINISSMGGLLPMPFAPIYCAAKHGVVGLTRSLYHLADPRMGGIRVNCVCPSFVDTPLVSNGIQASKGMRAAVNSQRGLISTDVVVDGILHLICDPSAAGVVLKVLPPPHNLQVQQYPAWHQAPVLPPSIHSQKSAASSPSKAAIKSKL